MSDGQVNIVRLELRSKSGLAHWSLCGLNILEYNDVDCPIEHRPDVVFLTHLTSHRPCSVHVSSLALKDRASTPDEMFGLPEGTTPYIRSRIGFHNIFYDLNEWPCIDACFFPRVTPAFWHSLLREEGDLEQMMSSHAFAFYVAPRSNTETAMERLLAAPFPGEMQWLKAVTDLYGIVVTVGHDGQFFNIYASDTDSLRLIDPSLSVATMAVESSDWFQLHSSELVWDDLNCCLMLSDRITDQAG